MIHLRSAPIRSSNQLKNSRDDRPRPLAQLQSSHQDKLGTHVLATSCETAMHAVTTLLSRSPMKRVRDVDEIAAGGHPFSLFLSPSLCLFHLHKKSGVLRSLVPASLFRSRIDGPDSQPMDAEEHANAYSVLRCPHWIATTACVSSPKRLGSLRRLAHATGHGHFVVASTSGRFFVSFN